MALLSYLAGATAELGRGLSGFHEPPRLELDLPPETAQRLADLRARGLRIRVRADDRLRLGDARRLRPQQPPAMQDHPLHLRRRNADRLAGEQPSAVVAAGGVTPPVGDGPPPCS